MYTSTGKPFIAVTYLPSMAMEILDMSDFTFEGCSRAIPARSGRVEDAYAALTHNKERVF